MHLEEAIYNSAATCTCIYVLKCGMFLSIIICYGEFQPFVHTCSYSSQAATELEKKNECSPLAIFVAYQRIVACCL